MSAATDDPERDDMQRCAALQVQFMVNALRAAGWDFAAVAVWHALEGAAPGSVSLAAGASMFELARHMLPGAPRMADNLRALADEIDAAHRQSGDPEVTEGYTHTIAGSRIDEVARRAALARLVTESIALWHEWTTTDITEDEDRWATFGNAARAWLERARQAVDKT
jgi:hypothetical protein